jgi:ribonuclease BN (tRNA processing enzyme)
MRIKILGSNGWYSTQTGNTNCVLIETKDFYLVLDTGDGLAKLDREIKSEKPIYLFLSHFHLDHIYGLHVLNKFHFSQSMTIFGQPGTKKILGQIIASPFTVPFSKLKFKVVAQDLREGINLLPKAPLPVEARFLLHADPCFGYRFQIGDKIITYCTDTGVCENLLRLAKGADLLITECTLKSGQSSPQWPHLNPEDAAIIAKRAQVSKLLLVHFTANIYQTLKERQVAEKAARKIFPETYATFDDWEIEI